MNLTIESGEGGAGEPAANEAVKPRDAATLILVDKAGDRPRFLMGRRSKGHGFMPGVFVFPGGAVEPGDIEIAPRFPLDPDAHARLHAASDLDATTLAALPLAAIRETFEETGLIFGSLRSLEHPPHNWSRFAAGSVSPRSEALVPVARAITPPGYPVRYDARFFAADAMHIADPRHELGGESDELEDLGWYDALELESLPLAQITRRILRDVESRLLEATLFDPRQKMPFYRVENGVSQRGLL